MVANTDGLFVDDLARKPRRILNVNLVAAKLGWNPTSQYVGVGSDEQQKLLVKLVKGSYEQV